MVLDLMVERAITATTIPHHIPEFESKVATVTVFGTELVPTKRTRNGIMNNKKVETVEHWTRDS